MTNNIQSIPNELLFQIMSYLDRATLLIASEVCRQWETLIHDTSWQFLCNSLTLNEDSDLMEQLENCGWSKKAHSSDCCR